MPKLCRSIHPCRSYFVQTLTGQVRTNFSHLIPRLERSQIDISIKYIWKLKKPCMSAMQWLLLVLVHILYLVGFAKTSVYTPFSYRRTTCFVVVLFCGSNLCVHLTKSTASIRHTFYNTIRMFGNIGHLNCFPNSNCHLINKWQSFWLLCGHYERIYT